MDLSRSLKSGGGLGSSRRMGPEGVSLSAEEEGRSFDMTPLELELSTHSVSKTDAADRHTPDPTEPPAPPKPPRQPVHPCTHLMRCGLALAILGGLSFIGTILSVTWLPHARDQRMLSTLVVTSEKSPGYAAFKSSNQSNSPVRVSYSFFSVNNSGDVLQGAVPVYEDKGPYVFTQRSMKASVAFSDGGKQVSYVTQTQYDFEPSLSNGDLSEQVTLLNMPYVTAVSTAGSESNMLLMGARTALKELNQRMFTDFMPTMKENAVAIAGQSAIKIMGQLLDRARYPVNGLATRWGGGCITYAFSQQCGFSGMSFLAAGASLYLGQHASDDMALWGLALETGIDKVPGHVIPPETVTRLWNASDMYGLFNLQRHNSSVRYGVSYWLHGDDTIKAQLMTHFDINEYQFQKLRDYVTVLYNSDELAKYVLKTFIASLSPEEQLVVSPTITSWEALVWRQWSIGDVVQVLNHYDHPASIYPEQPPELAWYLLSEGRPVWNYTISSSWRWSNDQAACFFNATLSSSTYFNYHILNLAPPRSTRTPFTRPDLRSTPMMHPLHECLSQPGQMNDMHGYLRYLAAAFVKPTFEQKVINASGGLFVTRSAESWLYGRTEPILQLALDKDDPRAALFSLLGGDDHLGDDQGPPMCVKSSDVENSYTACSLEVEDDGQFKYRKVANTYRTGKGSAREVGSLSRYRGDDVAWGIWPQGNITINAGAHAIGSKAQVGFSEGTQFPPLNAVDDTNSLTVFLSRYVLPLEFNATGEEVVLKGIKLKRFVLDPSTFSTTNPRAFMYSMNGGSPSEGIFNATDLATAPTYLSPPYFLGYPQYKSMACLQHFPLRQNLTMLHGSLLSVLSDAGSDVGDDGTGGVGDDGSGGVESDGSMDDGGVDDKGRDATQSDGRSSSTDSGTPTTNGSSSTSSPSPTTSSSSSPATREYHAFMDVEPYTGRTMRAYVAMQLSSSLAGPGDPLQQASEPSAGSSSIFDVWHTSVYPAPIVPIAIYSQSAEVGPNDAKMFKALVYRSKDALNQVKVVTFWCGVGLGGLGALIMIAVALHNRRRARAQQNGPSAVGKGDGDADEEAKAPAEEDDMGREGAERVGSIASSPQTPARKSPYQGTPPSAV